MCTFSRLVSCRPKTIGCWAPTLVTPMLLSKCVKMRKRKVEGEREKGKERERDRQIGRETATEAATESNELSGVRGQKLETLFPSSASTRSIAPKLCTRR